ncbi:MAG: RidA family protein [Legionellales bacterium]|jgi:enamine deaminase RidA (YjgF/YER057c/UK114 family)
MMETRLHTLGLTLPEPAAPAAHYVPFVVVNNLVFISGQLPMQNGVLQYTGKANAENIETAKQAAQLCALNILAQLQVACENDWDRVLGCVRLGGFVQCNHDFHQQPQIINGASELLTHVFGEMGRHARTAVGSNALPLNAMVEIDAIFNIAY